MENIVSRLLLNNIVLNLEKCQSSVISIGFWLHNNLSKPTALHSFSIEKFHFYCSPSLPVRMLGCLY